MCDRVINNICLLHKIALVWSISRNIFQPMNYSACLVGYGTSKNDNKKKISEALYISQCPLEWQLPNLLPKTVPLLIVTPSNPTPRDCPVKDCGNYYCRNRFPTQLLKVLSQIINVIPRKTTVSKMSQLHISYILIIKFNETFIALTIHLEIIINHRTLTDGDTVLLDRIFLPSQ